MGYLAPTTKQLLIDRLNYALSGLDTCHVDYLDHHEATRPERVDHLEQNICVQAAKQTKEKQQQTKQQPEAQKQQQAEKAAAAAVTAAVTAAAATASADAADNDDDADNDISDPVCCTHC